MKQFESNMYGDRRQELVIITVNNNESQLRDRLDMCLLTPEEMVCGPEEWIGYEDGFPR